MPSYNTPPPFRFSTQQRSHPPRSSAAKVPRFIFNTPQPSSSKTQFASTPRFVLSQPPKPANSAEDDINASDDEPPSSFSPAPRRKDMEPCLANRVEAIESLEEEKTLYSARDESDGIGHTDNEACSDTGNFDIDAEFDNLFPATPSRRKRRRISPSTSPRRANRRVDEADEISSTSDASQPASPGQPLLPDYQASQEDSDSITYENPSTPKATAFTSKQPRQSSSHPRFVFPLHTPFHASQSLNRDTASQTAPATVPAASTSRPQRSKPHFIFPRSPSPGHENSNINPSSISIPEPFSPSRHRSRRDGQSSGNGTNFVGGGMAVEARGWILEMASKVQQQHQLQETNRNRNLQQNQGHDLDPQITRYLLTTEVGHARCDYGNELERDSGNVKLKGSGIQTPMTIIRTHNQPFEQGHSEMINTSVDIRSRSLLLLGPPLRSHSDPTLSATQAGEGNRMREYPRVQKGSSVGVRKGFTWEIELGSPDNATNEHENQGTISSISNRKDNGEMSIQSRQRASQQGAGNGRWLVGVEWDVLR